MGAAAEFLGSMFGGNRVIPDSDQPAVTGGGSPGESSAVVHARPAIELKRGTRDALVLQLVEHLRQGEVSEFNAKRPHGALDLRGQDLSGLNLTGVDLRHADLTRAMLQGSDLTDAMMQHAVLERADLSDTILNNAKLFQANIRYATLERVREAKHAEFQEAKLWRAQLDSGNFSGAYFDNANLNSASLKNASFAGAHLCAALLVGANLTGCSFQNANMHRARLFQANGADVNFSGANLVGAEAISSYFTSSGSGEGARTSFDGAWIKGFKHDGAISEALLFKGNRHELPPEGSFAATPEPKDEKILVNGIPGSDKVIYDAAMAELDELIGLREVKDKIRSLMNHLQVSEVREQLGEPELDYTLHAVYTGSPGTGKTTVARIVARLFYALGAMPKDLLIEADKSDLVADYAGQTPGKTNRLVDSAMGGTLIIDEAYSLTQSEGDAYGQEAIATLTKRLEDDRKHFACVVTGYEKEMRTFVNANSGLKSRFSHFIQFPDYTTGELVDIMKLMLDKKHFRYTPEFLAAASLLLAAAKAKEGDQFGNGRTARHVFEKMTWRMSNRLVEGGILESKKRDVLLTPRPEDLPFEEILGIAAERLPAPATLQWRSPGGGKTGISANELSPEECFPNLTRESFAAVKGAVEAVLHEQRTAPPEVDYV